jgi:hypothetical protein
VSDGEVQTEWSAATTTVTCSDDEGNIQANVVRGRSSLAYGSHSLDNFLASPLITALDLSVLSYLHGRCLGGASRCYHDISARKEWRT